MLPASDVIITGLQESTQSGVPDAGLSTGTLIIQEEGRLRKTGVNQLNKSIRVVISEEPVAQARSRIAFCNGKVHSYTPEKSLNAQNLIKMRLIRYKDRMFVKGTAVKLTVCFYRTKSKWLPKYETLPFRKPDLDNMCKLIQDSMIGYLIEDDSQITSLSAKKRWSNRDTGYITIKVEIDKL